MPAVKLLLEETFAGGAVVLDLFNAKLNINDGIDSAKVVGETPLSTPHFKVNFKDGATFPHPGQGVDVEVPVTVSLLGGKLAAFQNIAAQLVIHRDDDQRATVQRLIALEQSVDFSWPGLAIQHCVAELSLGEKPVQLILKPKIGQAAGTFKLLGADFEFTDPLTFTADGVTGKCEASPATRQKLRDRLQSTVGTSIKVAEVSTLIFEVANDAWTVQLKAAFNIPLFVDGTGEMEVKATRRDTGKWTVESTVLLANAQRWGDPQGWFQIDKPSLGLRFVEKADGWSAEPRLGGKITFLPTAMERLGPTIADWFGDLFDGMSTEFDSKFDGSMPTIGLRPFAPFKLKALEMFELRVPRIDLRWPGTDNKVAFDLQGIELRLDIGDVSLRGVIPPLNIDPFKGKLTIGTSNSLSLDLSLSAPGGVKGSARVEYLDKETLRYLQGRGQLSTPTLPGVAVAFRVGQFRTSPSEAWTPTVLLYADAPVSIPLFPLVIVQQLGLGVGVNCEVQGTSRLTLAEARRRVEQGLPDVSDPNVWTPSKDTALTLLARLFLGPTGVNATPGFYAADMTLIITSEAQATAFGKLWLYTSVDDARTGDFQQQPAGLALMLLDAQEPSLRIAAQTTGRGLTSLKSAGLSGQLMGFSLPPMRLAFEATKNGIALYLGPNEVSGSLGPLSVRGTSLLAFRARFDGGKSYAMSHSSLSAGFNWSASASVGAVSLSASFNAGFAAELLLLGTFGDSKLMVYGSASIAMNAALSLHASVGFSIRIKCLFASYTISWSVGYDFRMEVHVDLGLEAALTTGSEGFGLRGHATAGVSVLGISARLTVPVAVNTGAVDEARSQYEAVGKDIKTILGI